MTVATQIIRERPSRLKITTINPRRPAVDSLCKALTPSQILSGQTIARQDEGMNEGYHVNYH